MRKLFVVGAWTALALSIPQAAQAETAKEIIKKVIEANGGEDNLKKYPAAKVTLKGTMQVMGQEVKVSGEDMYQIPGMTRSNIELEVLGMKLSLTQIYNNGKARITLAGKEMPISAAVKDEMKQAAELQRVSQFFPLLDEKAFEVSVIEKPQDVEEKPVVGLLVKPKGYKEVKLFFDAKTYLLVKTERQGIDPQEKEVKQETLLKDYKKFNGIPQPTKMIVFSDGKKTLETESTDYKLLEKIDKKEFDVSD